MKEFNCKKCGNCCSNFLPLLEKEIQKLKKLAKTENKHPLRTDWYSRCPFLNNQNKCDVYEDRPLICRSFSCYNFENKIYDKEYTKYKANDFKLTDLRKEIFKN